MKRIEKTVFISYRRTNSMTARAVYQDLTHHGYDCFLDYNSIDSGSFERIILENLASRAHFVLILTPSALERCGEPGDWLRREIEYAMETQRNIIPLMFEGFDFVSPSIGKHLTGKLSALSSYNAQRVPADFFEEAMAKVRNRFLNIPLDMVLHPRTAAADDIALEQQQAIAAQPAVTENDLSAEEWFEKGIQLDDNSDDEIYCYTEAIRLKPDFAFAYNNRGLAHYKQGQIEAAMQDYNEAIRLKPDYTDAHNNRGVAHKALGQYDAAIHDYTEAIRTKPDYALTYNNRGNTYKAMGQNEAAIQDYTAAIRVQPDYADAYSNRSVIYNEQGQYEAAIHDSTAAIRLNPGYADAYNNRGVAYNELGQYEAALRDLDDAIRLNPEYINAYYNRASIHNHQGRKQKAIADYRRYLDLGGGLRDGDQAQVEQVIRELGG